MVANVLLACGVAEEHTALCAEVQRNSYEAIHDIVQLTLDFRRTISESVISRDTLTTVVPPSHPFNPSAMVDEWAKGTCDAEGEIQGSVLGTTHLGLIVEEGSGGHGRRNVLLKPRVVLETMLDELYSEQKVGRAD